VTEEQGFFETNWAALTVNDWVGLIVTVGVAIVLLIAYLYVFHPKNREKLESQRYLVDGVDGDSSLTENLHGENK